MRKIIIWLISLMVISVVMLSGCNGLNNITKPLLESKIVIKDCKVVVDHVGVDKLYIGKVDVLVKNEGNAPTGIDQIVLSSGESKIDFSLYFETLEAGEEKNYSRTTYQSLTRAIGIRQIEGKISLTTYSGEILAEKNITIPIPIAEVGDTIPEVGMDKHNLSLTILSWKESDIAVSGPYSGGYYAYLARTGFKFIIMTFEFKNNWIREQTTPYLDSGDIATDKGYIYSVWDWIDNYGEYESREATQIEINTLIGDSAGYENLLPEESVVGCIVFEIPVGQTAIEVSIDDVSPIIELEW